MIGRVYRLSATFKAVAGILDHGRAGDLTDERGCVTWVEARNLPTAHPRAAARVMQVCARASQSRQPPLYRFSVGFAPSDSVDRDMMLRVADRTLHDLGLQDHQALIFSCSGRRHPYLNFMVNRVHPGTGTMWSNWHDYRRIERSLRAQEAELGLRVVPGKHSAPP